MIDLRKTNYLLIIINVVLLLTLLIVFFYSFYSSNKGQKDQLGNLNQINSSSVIQGTVNAEEYQIKHDKLTQAISSGDLSSCESLNGGQVNNCKDVIILNEAIQNSNSAKCDQILDREIKRSCNILLVN
ncbi:hypothetical protein CL656_03860 [bacterium]|nr:hypothetical protein [bacterium]|tara:strand:- start:6639 stop:7025 length:387 start_codon:yes stop_codon:yes gene_type:complete